ncbi:hypothetical protein BpHYR1_038295 [Brachionus plicatilis]|uniref:Uncharacterized protein n=1 Tax=Brachionus plicatilis TaxID=10195 RepID=A0A3M7SHY9_BRAPC|nr:hypothetical protein BpHYR1_038295 [Brachionus plicatilis]
MYAHQKNKKSTKIMLFLKNKIITLMGSILYLKFLEFRIKVRRLFCLLKEIKLKIVKFNAEIYYNKLPSNYNFPY